MVANIINEVGKKTSLGKCNAILKQLIYFLSFGKRVGRVCVRWTVRPVAVLVIGLRLS